MHLRPCSLLILQETARRRKQVTVRQAPKAAVPLGLKVVRRCRVGHRTCLLATTALMAAFTHMGCRRRRGLGRVARCLAPTEGRCHSTTCMAGLLLTCTEHHMVVHRCMGRHCMTHTDRRECHRITSAHATRRDTAPRCTATCLADLGARCHTALNGRTYLVHLMVDVRLLQLT